jgi:hypothetical protein
MPSVAEVPQIEMLRAWVTADEMADEHGTFTMSREFAAALLLEIDQLRDVLVFADGLAVSMSRQFSVYVTALADLHNDTTPRQGVLARAGCHPRGAFRGQ